MLRKLEKGEIEEAAELAYSLSLNPSTNSYQLRQSKEEFTDTFNRSFNYKDNELLGYFTNELIAVIYLDVLKKDLYLQTNALFIKKEFETVMQEFLNYIDSHYSGYDIYIGLPKENEKTINYLLDHHYQIIESSTDMRLKRDDFVPSHFKNKIIRIKEDHYSEFAEFHDTKANDIYWNSTRIKEVLNNWILYGYWTNSQIKGSIATRKVRNMIEIFALLIDDEYRNNGIEEDLITSTLIEGLEDPVIEDVVFFIDADDQYAEAFTKMLGFKVFSHYRCLFKKLNT